MKTLNLTNSPAFQGDLMIRRVDALPPGAREDTTRDARIVAHSDTGHHHVIDGPLRVFRDANDPLRCFVEARASVQLKHLREWDTHETLDFEGGTIETPAIFELSRQEEWTPEGWRRVED